MQAQPNHAEEALAEAVRRLGRPGFESAIWAWFHRAVAPDNLIVLAYRDGVAPQVMFRHSAPGSPVFGQLDSTYLGGAYLFDPYHALHLARVPPGLYRLSDVAPDAFQRSRYFNDYYRQTTLVDELTFIAYPAHGVTLNLCLGREGQSRRPFEARAIETCQRISPVVVALAEAHWSGLAATGSPPDAVTRQIRARLAEADIRLTPRQVEVALLILQGHSSASIALQLQISPQTVKVFRRQIYARCGLSSQAELFGLLMPLLGERREIQAAEARFHD
ncbi:MAG: LuxR C-terminal-related transcriptional regulator [Tabrizicola sp.]